jgi:hypothetical protein
MTLSFLFNPVPKLCAEENDFSMGVLCKTGKYCEQEEQVCGKAAASSPSPTIVCLRVGGNVGLLRSARRLRA